MLSKLGPLRACGRVLRVERLARRDLQVSPQGWSMEVATIRRTDGAGGGSTLSVLAGRPDG